jgi:hypothetical protein
MHYLVALLPFLPQEFVSLCYCKGGKEIKNYEDRMSADGVMLVPTFAIISHLIQKLKSKIQKHGRTAK